MSLKVVTIGGGSSYTPELMEGFIKRYDEFPLSELWLVDVEAGKEKQNIIYELCTRMVAKAELPIKIYQTLDRREALKDADFVTTQLRVGQLPARALDERIPLSHGMIGQETNGAGGLFKALRTVPVILDIIKDVEELCPDAWIVNFANPAGIVTQAVQRHSNFKKFVGVCNVPVSMKKAGAKALEANEDDTQMDLFGLNHFVFMSDFLVKGESKFQELKQHVLSNESQTVKNIAQLGFDSYFIDGLDLLLCPYHRYYFKEKEMLAIELGEFYQGKTRAEVVMELEEELFELYKDPNLNIKPPQLEQRGGAYYSDAACEVLSSIYNDKQQELYVIFAQNGHIDNIDPNWTVEMTARVGKNGPDPVERIKHFDERVLGYISAMKSFEIAAADAAVSGKYEDGLVALNLCPIIHSDEDAKKVYDELLIAHKQHLPQFDFTDIEQKIK